MKTDVTNYINAQLDVWEQKTQGWIFWNFKTEASAVSSQPRMLAHEKALMVM